MRLLHVIFLTLVLFTASFSNATIRTGLFDSGSGVANKNTGELLSNGNLSVNIYDDPNAGNLIYAENFTNVINNGSWNVMLGEDNSNPLYLQVNAKYYKSYYLNGELANFTLNNGAVVPRQYFYSPLGEFGTNSNTTGLYAVAFGKSTTSSGQSSTALGELTYASGFASTATGFRTNASANGATAMGMNTNASGEASLATGYSTSSSGFASTALGYGANANNTGAISIGTFTTSNGTYSTALGETTLASGNSATAIGSSSIATAQYATSIGYRNTASGISSTALGYISSATGPYSTAIGYQSTATNPYSLAAGYFANSSGDGATAFGFNSKANASYATALGGNTLASNFYATALGAATVASGQYSTALGASTTASGAYATTLGAGTTASGIASTAIGNGVITSGDYSFSWGNGGCVGVNCNNTRTGLFALYGGVCVTSPGLPCPTVNPGSIQARGSITANAFDLAEKFESKQTLKPGEVVVIGIDGKIERSTLQYDSAVAGIVTTNPGLVLGWDGDVQVALAGRVPVKVTNENGDIHTRDLLTTSSKPGYAMKCDTSTQNSKLKCVGAVIGKAMESCTNKECTITALVTLQ